MSTSNVPGSVDHDGHTRSRSRSPIKVETNKSKLSCKITSRRNATDGINVKTVLELRDKMKQDRKKKPKNKDGPSKMAESDVPIVMKGTVSETKDSKETLVNKLDNTNASQPTFSDTDLDWNETDGGNVDGKEGCVINKGNVCDNTSVNNVDLNSKRDPEQNENDDDEYRETDKGPFLVHLAVTEGGNNDETLDIYDVTIGLKMRKMKVKGVREVRKVSRRELKVIFSDKDSANEFLKGNIPTRLGVKAYIPRYNIEKTGIIFDIPVQYDETQLLEAL